MYYEECMTKKGWHDACTENPVMGVGRFKGSSVFGIQQQATKSLSERWPYKYLIRIRLGNFIEIIICL